MKVFTLLGDMDYEGQTLVGVFASKAEMLDYIKSQATVGFGLARRSETLGYDALGYVESELGQAVDFHCDVEWL